MTHFLNMLDFSKEDLEATLALALAVKNGDRKFDTPPLNGKVLGMIFQKSSTRTRLSFEVGMSQLGGKAIYIQDHEIGLGKREPIKDIARVMSRYMDGVIIRAKRHEDIVEFSDYASIPVINALSDLNHPCQAMADMLTIKERMDLKESRLCYIGDGNNVCYSLMAITKILELPMTVVAPSKYHPDISQFSNVTLQTNLQEAVKSSNVLYTDVWTSMGQEAEEAKRLSDFSGYTLDENLLSLALPNSLVMHCLPAHRGQEISDGAMEHKQSVVFDQAENRMHAQKAILLNTLGGIYE